LDFYVETFDAVDYCMPQNSLAFNEEQYDQSTIHNKSELMLMRSATASV